MGLDWHYDQNGAILLDLLDEYQIEVTPVGITVRMSLLGAETVEPRFVHCVLDGAQAVALGENLLRAARGRKG